MLLPAQMERSRSGTINPKKRLRQYPKFNQAVPAIAWSCDGRQLAVAESYNWDEGRDGASKAPPPRLLIREVGDEVKVSCILS